MAVTLINTTQGIPTARVIEAFKSESGQMLTEQYPIIAITKQNIEQRSK